jgi:hypothetical protein
MVASQVMALVDEIRRRRLSRNKNFALLSRREYREARRIQRYLDGLADSLLALDREGELDLSLESGPDGRFVLTVEVARMRVRRQCYLTQPELDYLAKHHADVAQCIADATGRPLRCGVAANPRIGSQGDDRDV